MRYITFVRMAEDLGDPPPGLVEAMGKELEQAYAEGTVIDAGGLSGMRDSTEIRLRDGQITQTDGPYAEGKAVAGARRVIELHLQHWPGWEGAVEIRQMFHSRER